MATNAANLDLMMSRLGGRASPVLRTLVLAELNKQIRECERSPTKPWFLEDRLDGSLTPDQDYIDIPATFLSEVEEGSFRLYEPNVAKWVPLRKVDYDQLDENVIDSTNDTFPLQYAMRGSKIFFNVTPDAAYDYRWECNVRTTAVSDNATESTNPWLVEFFDYISLVTLDKIARLHIRSAELIENLREPLTQARDSYWREVEARQQTNRDYGQEPED